jgi:beta-lactam-binding protein with PASTA domain
MRKFIIPVLQWGVFLTVLGGFFMLAFWLMFFRGLEQEFQSASRVIPGLVGKPLSDAEAITRSKGLGVHIHDRLASATIPAGVIISQEPPADTPAREAQLIQIVVSAGKAVVVMPAVAGLNRPDAEAQLANRGLKIGQVSLLYSQAQEGKVVAQFPVPGASLIEGEKVALLVGKTPLTARYLMPELIGRSTDAVRQFFSARGFPVKIEGPGSGVVRKQFPPAGAPLLAGSQVVLESSAGLDPTAG